MKNHRDFWTPPGRRGRRYPRPRKFLGASAAGPFAASVRAHSVNPWLPHYAYFSRGGPRGFSGALRERDGISTLVVRSGQPGALVRIDGAR